MDKIENIENLVEALYRDLNNSQENTFDVLRKIEYWEDELDELKALEEAPFPLTENWTVQNGQE